MEVVSARLNATENLAWGFRKAAGDGNDLDRKIILCEELMKIFTVMIRLSRGICLSGTSFMQLLKSPVLICRENLYLQRFSKAPFPYGKCRRRETFAILAVALLNLQ
jgi:hypothetical protein